MVRKFGTIIISILVLLFLVVSVFACGTKTDKKNEEIEISLEEFQHEQEYIYAGINWGCSYDEVSKRLSCNLVEVSTNTSAHDEYSLYRSESQFILDGKKSSSSFEFNNKGLKIVKFTFSLEGDYEEWVNAQLKKLINLYGEQNRKSAAALGEPGSATYIWETEKTMLQLTQIINESNAYVMIAVGEK